LKKNSTKELEEDLSKLTKKLKGGNKLPYTLPSWLHRLHENRYPLSYFQKHFST